MEDKNEYKRRLLLEYRDVILKRERLDVYLINNSDLEKVLYENK